MASVDVDRFDRQRRVNGWNQEAVGKSKVLVVGAGALGNEVVKNLLQLGVERIALVDYDEVVEANLNRCVFFSPKDAKEKRKKAVVLSQKAREFFPLSRVEPILKRVEHLPEDFFGELDFAFGCLDNLGARLHLNSHTYGKTPLIDGGTAGFMGKVQVVRSPSSCLECSVTKRDYNLLWKRYSCVGDLLDFLNPKMPALSTTTSVVASIQVNEFLKELHKAGELNAEGQVEEELIGKYLFFNGLNNQSRVFVVPKRKGCPVHLVE